MRKIRLSKTKANKFNESGQLLAFYSVSIACAAVIFRDVIILYFFLSLALSNIFCFLLKGTLLSIV